jgi:Na+/melibiose symporter-like transporter
MNTQTRSKSLILPIDKRKADRKVKTCSISVIQAKKSKFLFTLTVFTWIVAVFLSIGFFFAVRKNLAQADLLACILLGTVFLGWILFAWHFRSVNKPVQPTGQGDRHEK